MAKCLNINLKIILPATNVSCFLVNACIPGCLLHFEHILNKYHKTQIVEFSKGGGDEKMDPNPGNFTPVVIGGVSFLPG